ncbi:Crp/Fnr family transcriptional regulator [Terribacillus sp. 179-K 1B1 HS]|uniref:Crp/Fnr family transcriptional regulator n=1 Tax=Terribacillus sp. 179-K 1B1 HS TaxID=3142388 RepID=UPI0039A1610D
MDKTTDPYCILQGILSRFSIEEKEWLAFKDGTSIKQIKTGTCIIETGQLVQHAYFCTSGLFRLFCLLPDGREYNVAFTLENDFATSYASMIDGQPSTFSIEAMEDSIVIEIPYLLLQELMNKSHMWERFVRISVERLYTRKEERERELLYLPALERYQAFLLKYPGLEKRIAQYHIASYIGISPVSLSRLLHTVGN